MGLLLCRAKRKWMCMSKWELALTFSINKEGPSAFEESHTLLNKGIRVRCTMFCFVPFNFKSLESISHLCRADTFTDGFLLTHLPVSVSPHPMSFGKTTLIWIAGYLCLTFFSLVTLIVRKADKRGLLTPSSVSLVPHGVLAAGREASPMWALGTSFWLAQLSEDSQLFWLTASNRQGNWAFKFYIWKKNPALIFTFISE